MITSAGERETPQTAGQGPGVHAKWERMWQREDNQEVGLEAAIFEGKRNSSLVERGRAENTTGLKHGTEAAGRDLSTERFDGRGALQRLRSRTARTGGGSARADADMSSEKTGEKPVRRKPEVSRGRFILPG